MMELHVLYRALWYNYVILTNKMHTFWINVLIQFFMSSACFEHNVFIIRNTILYMQFFMVCFLCLYVSSLVGWKHYRAHPSPPAYINVRKMYHKELHVQMVFLMMNSWCSKHGEDMKNWIKTLFYKVCILLVNIT
jgi:hypothetical protein